MNEVSWDGKSADGVSVSEGLYSVAIEATASDGSAVSASPFMVGEVQKVQYMDGAAYLMIGDTMIMLGDVIEVSE